MFKKLCQLNTSGHLIHFELLKRNPSNFLNYNEGFLICENATINEHFEKRNAVKIFSVNKQKYTVMY